MRRSAPTPEPSFASSAALATSRRRSSQGGRVSRPPRGASGAKRTRRSVPTRFNSTNASPPATSTPAQAEAVALDTSRSRLDRLARRPGSQRLWGHTWAAPVGQAKAARRGRRSRAPLVAVIVVAGAFAAYRQGPEEIRHWVGGLAERWS